MFTYPLDRFAISLSSSSYTPFEPEGYTTLVCSFYFYFLVAFALSWMFAFESRVQFTMFTLVKTLTAIGGNVVEGWLAILIMARSAVVVASKCI